MKILSDGSDLEGIEKTEDIQYMKLLRSLMRAIDGWPKGPKESWFHRYCMFFVELNCLAPGIIYLKNNIGKLSYLELGHTYITVFMNGVALVRSVMVLTKKYNNLFFDFLNVMHLFGHRNDSEYAYKTHILVHKICHFFSIYTLIMMVNGIFLFNLTPLYNSYAVGMFRSEVPANATFELSVYYSLPFDYSTNIRGYLVVAIFNCFISIIVSTYFCIVDLYISLLVFHLWGHLRLLIYNLENFPKPASLLAESKESKDAWVEHKYTEEEKKEVFSKLREYIHHHGVIVSFTAKMSDTFGVVLLVKFLFHHVSGCLLLLECSELETKALMRYGLLTVILFQQLIQISVIFELLGSSSDRLVDAVYSVPWEYMDTKGRKLVYNMLVQSQRSLNIKVMSLFPVGVQTMTTILKSSFSYFVMLRTVADEE